MWKKRKGNFVSADTIKTYGVGGGAAEKELNSFLTLGLDGVYWQKYLLFLLSLLTFWTHSFIQ
jgi:hypothetical protein